jgi:predicted amidohydrolase YtcJ
MRREILRQVCVVLTVLLIASVRARGQISVLALVGATIITGNGDPPIADGVIIIDGGRIRTIGQRGQVPIPSNAKQLDLHGKFITPGLIDTNVHLVLTIFPEFYVRYGDRLEDVALESAQVALKYDRDRLPENPILKFDPEAPWPCALKPAGDASAK